MKSIGENFMPNFSVKVHEAFCWSVHLSINSDHYEHVIRLAFHPFLLYDVKFSLLQYVFIITVILLIVDNERL